MSNRRLHLSYYLYLNRKVKAKVGKQERGANGSQGIFLGGNRGTKFLSDVSPQPVFPIHLFKKKKKKERHMTSNFIIIILNTFNNKHCQVASHSSVQHIFAEQLLCANTQIPQVMH